MNEVPALPTPFNIPPATVARWLALPSDRPLEAPLTRADLDNLFFAIDFNQKAIFSVQKALIDYTNGQLDEANNASSVASVQLAESANRLRIFMNAIMASATVQG